MNSFGQAPLIPSGMHPLDMMGYGSQTVNFNPRSQISTMPTYYSDAFYQGSTGSMSANMI